MGRHRELDLVRTGTIIVLVTLIWFATMAVAMAATPTQPTLAKPFVWVSDVGVITAQWNASTDADAHPITYTLYRDVKPITAAAIAGGSATLEIVVDDYTGTTYTGAANASEVAQSFVWYYAVRAKANNGGTFEYSAVSKSAAPNMHGWPSDTANSIACERCHSVHGAYGDVYYRDVALCYTCHAGSTSATTGARSTYNVKSDFLEYDDQTAGSKHVMGNDDRRCSACHSPHRTPYYYDINGVYQPTNSFRAMLRIQTSATPSYTYTSRNDDTAENTSSCLLCHGATSANIGYVGASGAYSYTGGDHNESAYAGAAHGTGVILSNDTDTSKPQVQCLACHDNHASTLDKLVAYRKDYGGLTTAADLCYSCHSTSSSESRSSGTAPFSWNDRDVEDEFTSGVSTHPTVSAESGRSLTCMNCHNVHYLQTGTSTAWQVVRYSDPDNTKDSPASTTTFCLGCHDGTAPASLLETDTIVPYTVGFSAATSWPYFPGWDKSATGFAFTSSGHYTTSGQKALCENCHDPHASDFARLTAWTMPSGATGLNAGTRANSTALLSREEYLCYQCHGNGTVGKQATGAKNVATAASSTYAHPISTSGIHTDTETSSNLAYSATTSKRHSECTDCHDPHATRQASGSALHTFGSSAAGAALAGVWGVDPGYGTSSNALNWTVPSAASFASVRLGDDTTDYEAYLCFKCHSSNTTLDTATYTDQALEFNPSNYGEHNVLGQSVGMESSFQVTAVGDSTTSTVTWAIPTVAVFRTDITIGPDSMLTCTDCHTNSTADAKGPHGSSAQWIIDPAYSQNWERAGLDPSRTYGIGYKATSGSAVTDGSQVICAKCHDLNGTGAQYSNTAHSRNAHYITNSDEKFCITCHIQIPHGWKRPRLLGYADDPAQYATTGNGGGAYPLDGIQVTSHSVVGGVAQWNCTDCHTTGGTKHAGGANTPNPWP